MKKWSGCAFGALGLMGVFTGAVWADVALKDNSEIL